jgi:Asp-tRNA(Asn)/Glu-tRNA(Gln) amidotransferase A subunit family amidase
MLHEVREYVAMPGRIDELIARFVRDAVPLFRKHGMEVVDMGLTVVGDRSFDEVVYTLAFADAAEMEAKWAAFLGDEATVEMFARTEARGPLVASIRRRLLQTAPFAIESVG